MNQAGIPRAAEWSAEQIRRYWDWLSGNPHIQASYFSFRMGKGVMRFLAAAGLLQGNILDFGCGKGHLLKMLLAHRLSCFGADSSAESVNHVNLELAAFPDWHGAKQTNGFSTGYADQSFDLVLCLETLEHIPEEETALFFEESRRLLKPGGRLFLTVPLAEDLSRETIYCPFCQSLFHRWQHLDWFTPAKLTSLISSHDFTVEWCGTLNFDTFQTDFSFPRLTLLNLSCLKAWLQFRACRLLDTLFPRSFPDDRVTRFRLGRGPHTQLYAVAGPGRAPEGVPRCR